MNAHLEQLQQALQERLELLETQNRQLTIANKRLHRELLRLRAARQDFEDQLVAAFRQTIMALELPRVTAPAPDPRPRGEEVAFFQCADWQLGKVTSSYNPEVCAERIDRYIRKGLQITELHRSHHPVRTAVVFLAGDLVEGEGIFPSQPYETDLDLYSQVSVVGFRIAFQALQQLLGAFERVEVYCEAGNHGVPGGTRRQQFHPLTNGDRMLYRNLANTFAVLGEDRIHFTIRDGRHDPKWYQVIRIGNYRPLLTHGDVFKSSSGFPFTAASKLVLGWKAGAIPEPFDDIYAGHWHHRIKFEIGTTTLRISGAPETDNDFARRVLGTTSRATQWLGFVDPRRGNVTSEYDIYLEQD